MIESWVIDRLNPLTSEKLLILADPQRAERTRIEGSVLRAEWTKSVAVTRSSHKGSDRWTVPGLPSVPRVSRQSVHADVRPPSMTEVGSSARHIRYRARGTADPRDAAEAAGYRRCRRRRGAGPAGVRDRAEGDGHRRYELTHERKVARRVDQFIKTRIDAPRTRAHLPPPRLPQPWRDPAADPHSRHRATVGRGDVLFQRSSSSEPTGSGRGRRDGLPGADLSRRSSPVAPAVSAITGPTCGRNGYVTSPASCLGSTRIGSLGFSARRGCRAFIESSR